MKKIIILLQILFIYSTFAFSQNNEITKIILEVKEKYVPDTRVCVYNVEAKQLSNSLTIVGEISDKNIYQQLIKLLDNIAVKFENNIRLLPDKKIFEEKIWAIVPLSVIQMSANPFFAAETVSQSLMGTPVKLLDKTSYGWYQIQTPEGYIGWTSTNLVALTDQELRTYNSANKLIVKEQNTFVFEKKNNKSTIVADLTLGNIINLQQKYIANDYCKVILPDGRKGYVNTSNTMLFSEWKKSIHLTGENLISLSQKFIGLPYIWGGTSSRGMDCSGFTKMIYFMHGVIMPRDASQQFLYGVDVSTNSNFENLQKGDLLFFGDKNLTDLKKSKISHVAMYIGNNQYIHSSNMVRISSLNSAHSNYDENYIKRFVGAKRYIGTQDITNWNIFNHEWYK